MLVSLMCAVATLKLTTVNVIYKERERGGVYVTFLRIITFNFLNLFFEVN